jgi:signal transduction histidine kinase
VVDEMGLVVKEGQLINVSCEGPDTFITDHRLLKNILINLLSNAIKFSSEGASIWLQVTSSGDQLVVSVKDEGIGIAAEDQLHLFSSFFRARNVVNIEGTGLGLHIVKKYVELLHGNIKLESVLHKGTAVTITLVPLQDIVKGL